MSQASSGGGGGGGANIDLDDSLLLHNRKYTKIWRRGLYIGFVISLKKQTITTTASGSYESPPSPQSPLSSVPYTSLSSSEHRIDIDSPAEEDAEQRITNDIARIVKEQDLNSLLQLGGVDRICSVLTSQSQHSKKSTADKGNLGNLGITVAVHGTSFSSFLLKSCKHNFYTSLMLLISAGLSFAIEFKVEGPRYGWHDGVAIVFAVLLLVGFSSMANFWRERQMMKSAKKKGKLEFTVKRGEEFPVARPISDIMVGDMVCLRQGDEVPADGLFVNGDISVMAGAIKRKSDRGKKPFLIAGSKVVEGQGQMLVVASIGNQMNLAEMHSSMSYNLEKRGLLESLIEKPSSDTDKAALLIYIIVALVVYIRLICKKDADSGGGLPEIKGKISIGLLVEALERMFLRPQGSISMLTGVFTVVLCVQHGVPLMVTISLSCQIDKVVSDQDAVLNDLTGCTTMGLVTVICMDVSGGLMEVSRILMGETDLSKVVEGSETDLVVLDVLKEGVSLSVLAPELSLSPMSASLVSWAETRWGMNIKSFTEKFQVLKHSKLNSDKEGRGVLVSKVVGNEQVMYSHWSGAASTILEMCSLYYDSKGERHAMENHKIKFGQVIKEMGDSGLETIAFACRQTQVAELEQDELILLGLIGLKYTYQESTNLALENLRNTGIQIKLVSEDEIMLVKNIASGLGLEVSVDGHDRVLEGKELQDLNGEARLDKVQGALAMGGFCPEDKLLMVRCLKERGHVVAFVGRRLSDTSVLKEADVGIVHNYLSRIADKESGISIKCFSALEPIVRAGRSKYRNIQKFLQLHMTCSISGALITLIATVFTGESPLTPIQLIWVNILLCLIGSLMMVMELSSQEQLAKKVRKTMNQPIITKEIWKNIVIQVLYQTFVCMILESGGHVSDSEKKIRKTMIFNTFLLCQLFNLLDTMHLLKREVLKIVVQNYCFLVALGGCFLVQVLVIEFANDLAGCTKLNATEWGICFLVGSLSWVFGCTLKILPVILSTNSQQQVSTQPTWFYLSWGFPFLMLFMFPVGLMFNQIGMTFL